MLVLFIHNLPLLPCLVIQEMNPHSVMKPCLDNVKLVFATSLQALKSEKWKLHINCIGIMSESCDIYMLSLMIGIWIRNQFGLDHFECTKRFRSLLEANSWDLGSM
jgi:hypothetical protein